MMLPKTGAPTPSCPKVGDIVYTRDTENPKTGDIRELIIFSWERSWKQIYEVYNGLWWIRYKSERSAEAASKQFKKKGGGNG